MDRASVYSFNYLFKINFSFHWLIYSYRSARLVSFWLAVQSGREKVARKGGRYRMLLDICVNIARVEGAEETYCAVRRLLKTN